MDIESAKSLKNVSLWRVLFFWLLWITFIVIITTLFNSNSWSIDSSELFITLALDGILLALLLEFKLKDISLKPFLSNNLKAQSDYLIFFIPLLLASIGFAWLDDYLLYLILPDYLESRNIFLDENPFFDPTKGLLHTVIIFISACLVAPFFEEFLFRGVILEKLKQKWRIIVAVMASSLLFGILHYHLISAFVFGLILCLIYLETNSLLIPIGFHFLHNLLFIVYTLLWPEHQELNSGFDYLFDYLWIDIPSLLIGASWLAWFIYSRKNLLKASSE